MRCAVLTKHGGGGGGGLAEPFVNIVTATPPAISPAICRTTDVFFAVLAFLSCLPLAPLRLDQPRLGEFSATRRFGERDHIKISRLLLPRSVPKIEMSERADRFVDRARCVKRDIEE